MLSEKFLGKFMFKSGLSEKVGPSELLARFVFKKKMFFAKNGKPKPATMYPNRNNNQTSVSRIDGLNLDEIKELGYDCKRLRQDDPPLFGHVELLNQSVLRNELDTLADDIPPRHANIVGWEAFEDSKQKLIAAAIAQDSTYCSV